MSVEPYLGEIGIFPIGSAPDGWAQCNGQHLSISQNQALFSLLGTNFGGDGRVDFGVPDLRGRVAIHSGEISTFLRGGKESHALAANELPAHTHQAAASSAPASATSPAGNLWADGGKNVYAGASNVQMSPQAVSSAGGSQAHENMSPFLTLNFCIAMEGLFPSSSGSSDTGQFLGEIRIFPYTFEPAGWAWCDGRLIQLSNDMSALFSLLGTLYGGNGQTNFALPDLTLRAPLHPGQGSGLSLRDLAETGGQREVTLLQSEMPSHTHAPFAAAGAGVSRDPTNNAWGTASVLRQGVKLYGPAGGANMSAQALATTGSGQLHTNMPPYQELHFAIATQGAYPQHP